MIYFIYDLTIDKTEKFLLHVDLGLHYIDDHVSM